MSAARLTPGVLPPARTPVESAPRLLSTRSVRPVSYLFYVYGPMRLERSHRVQTQGISDMHRRLRLVRFWRRWTASASRARLGSRLRSRGSGRPGAAQAHAASGDAGGWTLEAGARMAPTARRRDRVERHTVRDTENGECRQAKKECREK